MKNKKILLIALVTVVVLGAGIYLAAGDNHEHDTQVKKDNNGVELTKNDNNNNQTKKTNMEFLTKEEFKKKVFDYEKNKEWKYEGTLPCIVDFYADWCGPCKMISPILVELAEEYDGKIVIYKVDTEAEQELAAAFGIRSIPSLLFVPMDGQPQMAVGALTKEGFKQAIDEVPLGVPKN